MLLLVYSGPRIAADMGSVASGLQGIVAFGRHGTAFRARGLVWKLEFAAIWTRPILNPKSSSDDPQCSSRHGWISGVASNLKPNFFYDTPEIHASMEPPSCRQAAIDATTTSGSRGDCPAQKTMPRSPLSLLARPN